MPNTYINVSFDVTGAIEQEIQILNEDTTPDEFVEKLQSGQYLTTVDVEHSDVSDHLTHIRLPAVKGRRESFYP